MEYSELVRNLAKPEKAPLLHMAACMPEEAGADK